MEERTYERGCQSIIKALIATGYPALTFLVHPSGQSHSPSSQVQKATQLTPVSLLMFSC